MSSERIAHFIASERECINRAFVAASAQVRDRDFALLLIELASAFSAKTIVELAKKHRIVFRPESDGNPFIYIGYLPFSELDSFFGPGTSILFQQCRARSNPQWMIVGILQSERICFESFAASDCPPDIP